jgi:hypothetical protein
MVGKLIHGELTGIRKEAIMSYKDTFTFFIDIICILFHSLQIANCFLSHTLQLIINLILFYYLKSHKLRN